MGSGAYCDVAASKDASSAAHGVTNSRSAKGANRRVYLADSQGWAATFEFDETLRRNALKAVNALLGRGLTLYMLSGDTQAAAGHVAQQLGLQNFHGDCSPEDKLAFMKALQAKGCKVMMVGDGLNDGPTLAAADVSVAIGAAVPLAQAQSDLVIPGAQLFLLPAMLSQAKSTLRIVRQNLAWAAIYNASCVPLALAGFLPAWLAGLGMALSSLLVIANAARLSQLKSGL